MDGAGLAELIESEGVTFSAGVSTIHQALLEHLETTGDSSAPETSPASSRTGRCT